MSQSSSASWWRFCAWATAGSLLIAGLVGAFGALVVLLPIGAGAIAALVWRSPVWPEPIGVGGGVGALALAVAFLNRNYRHCSAAPSSGTTYAGYRAPICNGGTNPIFWLLLGLTLTLLSVTAFTVLRHRQGKHRLG